MKAVILAAGKSTRTYPLTLTKPKPLLPFLKGTIIDYTLNTLKEAGITEAILVVHYMKQMIQEKLGDDYKGVRITYVDQKEPKGTGHAILVTKDCFEEGENFLVLMGDDIYAKETIEAVMQKSPSLAVREVKTPSLYGIYEVKQKNGELIATSIEEKPEKPKSNLANLGLYHFETSFFKHLEKIKPSPRGELEVTDAIATYLKKKEIRAVKAEPYWLPIGHPWDLLTATERLIGKKNIIDETTKTGKDTEIKHCVIGKNVKIGEGCTIEDSIVFDNVTVKDRCVISNSIIGEGVKIGRGFVTIAASDARSQVNGKMILVNRKFGTTIGDGTEIGEDVETEPGVKIWPGLNITEKKIEYDVRE